MIRRMILTTIGVASALLGSMALSGERLQVVPMVSLEQRVLVPATLGVVVNLDDPKSVALGREYAQIRGVPEQNIIGLHLPKANYVPSRVLKKQLDVLRSSERYGTILAFVLAFDRPYRVGKNQSITSAFSLGIDERTFSGTCSLTALNPDAGAAPGAVMIAKPAMLLSVDGDNEADRVLARRGKAADGSEPAGDVFLIKTLDEARSVPREASMDRAKAAFAREISISMHRQSDGVKNADGIIGYQIGLPVVTELETNTYLPGAFVDHLTSFGGALREKKGQTTIAAFLRAGATAAYGTIREPCNYSQKFPDPYLTLRNYLAGDTIMEAYWKSVTMVTEGLFVGEPLARPFSPFDAEIQGDRLTLRTNRHSASFLNDTAQSNSHHLAVFTVQSGTPKLIGSGEVKGPFKRGDLVADFQLQLEPDVVPIIGIVAD